MRSLLIVAVGVWIGREIYTNLAKNQAREKEVNLRKALDAFIQKQLPVLSVAERKKEIENVLKP